jgi:hypothetical protein
MDIDEKVYQEALNNPFLGLNLAYNYATVQQTIGTCANLLQIYLTTLNANNGISHTAAAIAELHYLFSIIFYYEQRIDCSDPRSIDCACLKALIAVYKETGVYPAYLKYSAQQQIVSIKQQGGAWSLRCFMYIIAFAIFSLLEVEPIFIDRLDEYSAHLNEELRVYRNKPSKELIARLGLTKLFSMNNRFGSSTFQTLLFGNTPETIREINANIIRPEYYTRQILNGVVGLAVKKVGYDKPGEFILLQGLKLSGGIPTTPYMDVDHMRDHAHDVYTHLVQIYEMPADDVGAQQPHQTSYQSYYTNYVTMYMKQMLPNMITGAQEANYRRYRAYIGGLRDKLHLAELSAATTTIDFKRDALIITFVAYIHDQAFNLLYNTQNGRFCIFDLNVLDKIIKAARDATNKISVGKFFIEYEPEITKNRLKQFVELVKRVARVEPLLPFIPIFIAEEGFWEGSTFKNNPNFKNINIYVGEGEIFSEYMDMANIPHAADASPPAVFIENMYVAKDTDEMSDIVANNVHGWGCATLDTCGESAIELMSAYSELLHANKQFIHTINAVDYLIDAKTAKWGSLLTKGVTRYMSHTPTDKETRGANLYSSVLAPDIPYVEKVTNVAQKVDYDIAQMRKSRGKQTSAAKGGRCGDRGKSRRRCHKRRMRRTIRRRR